MSPLLMKWAFLLSPLFQHNQTSLRRTLVRHTIIQHR